MLADGAPREYVLGYWDIRGLAAPIRLTLHFSSTPYRDELYSLVSHEGKWKSSWPPKAKELLAAGSSSFPNLPYLVVPSSTADGAPTYVMQSGAILRHVARVGGVMGESEAEVLRVDELLEQTTDLRNEMTRLVYGADFQEKRDSFCKESLTYYFSAFERYLSNNKKVGCTTTWFVGDHVTVADFAIYDALDVAAHLMRPLMNVDEQYPLTCEHRKAVRSLPQLEQYFQSSLASLPFNNKVAFWGGTLDGSNL